LSGSCRVLRLLEVDSIFGVGGDEVDDDFLTGVGSVDGEADVVGGDGEFAACAINEDDEADDAGAAEIDEGVECGADGASGVEDIIDEEKGAVIEAEVHVCAAGDGDGMARGEVIAVHGDVERADVEGGVAREDFGEGGGEALREEFAAGTDADDGEGECGAEERFIGEDGMSEGVERKGDSGGVHEGLKGRLRKGVHG